MPVEDAYHLNVLCLDMIENDIGQDWKRTNLEAELGSPPPDAWVPCKQPLQRSYNAMHELFRGICPDALGVIAPNIV